MDQKKSKTPASKKGNTKPFSKAITVEEGSTISFDAAGEQVRVTSIENGVITFEKTGS